MCWGGPSISVWPWMRPMTSLCTCSLNKQNPETKKQQRVTPPALEIFEKTTAKTHPSSVQLWRDSGFKMGVSWNHLEAVGIWSLCQQVVVTKGGVGSVCLDDIWEAQLGLRGRLIFTKYAFFSCSSLHWKDLEPAPHPGRDSICASLFSFKHHHTIKLVSSPFWYIVLWILTQVWIM